MATLENLTVKYTDLVSEIVTGQVKIPQFQRKFVWGIKESAKLLDSVIKGYPIGTFIYWRTNERLRSIRNLGNITLPEPIEGEFINYVLDGQQRLTSLFATLKGLEIIDDEGKTYDYSKMYIDLNAESDEDIIITDISKKEITSFIKIKDLMSGSLTLLASYPQQYHEIIDHYKTIIQSFSFSVINLKDATIDVATEVFTRLNVGGKALTLFEIMVAKTYDANKPFDLSVEYENLKLELRDSQYDTIPSSTVLQVISILLENDCTRKQILKIEKERFIEIWDRAVDCIKMSIDFFRSYGIKVSKILPYNALIVPFSYFFYHHHNTPTGIMKKRLEDFFWRVSLGFRYSSGVENKLAQDIEKIDTIINDQLPKYEWSININEEYISNNGEFSTGKAFIKAILCLYAKQYPKSFNNNLDVILDNSWLKIASSKNYHHFFPKSWLKNEYPELDFNKINHIVNITIVDDFLNKRTIRIHSPAVYMNTFRNENSELGQTMLTHLIDIDHDGIFENNYELFFTSRLQRISTSLNMFIITQELNSDLDLEVYEDINEIDSENLN